MRSREMAIYHLVFAPLEGIPFAQRGKNLKRVSRRAFAGISAFRQIVQCVRFNRAADNFATPPFSLSLCSLAVL